MQLFHDYDSLRSRVLSRVSVLRCDRPAGTVRFGSASFHHGLLGIGQGGQEGAEKQHH